VYEINVATKGCYGDSEFWLSSGGPGQDNAGITRKLSHQRNLYITMFSSLSAVGKINVSSYLLNFLTQDYLTS
jgi:hypothetical protein